MTIARDDYGQRIQSEGEARLRRALSNMPYGGSGKDLTYDPNQEPTLGDVAEVLESLAQTLRAVAESNQNDRDELLTLKRSLAGMRVLRDAIDTVLKGEYGP